MPDGKNDRVREIDFVRVLVDGSCDNGRVDNHGVIGSQSFAAQFHAGILGGKVHTDVFVQDKRYSNFTCKRKVLINISQRMKCSVYFCASTAKSFLSAFFPCSSKGMKWCSLLGRVVLNYKIQTTFGQETFAVAWSFFISCCFENIWSIV